ncbi:prepilin peptidase [Roseomonas sp. SSH11]|uniref:Prepilin peptidase n=1 Tax=Pararoseomonas baculiformis TaxID=2820812 RepID=A0ABS4AE90_9PROT|nr:prepilin peptidase [Pararoseomonas baculiformis]MBP0445291.1 prepilin peptidase [Pararoseomonas baculiformis]
MMGHIADATLILVMVGLLLVAAWRDIATRIIPDSLSLALLLAAFLMRAPAGLSPFLASLGAALLLFGVLFALAMRGLLGGGDVKLAGALALAFPPSATWDFVVATILAGGLLGAAYILAARLLPQPGSFPAREGLLGRVLVVEGWRIRRRGPLPYAVAIAIGGVATLLATRGV